MKILFIANRIGPATKEFTGLEVKDETWVATFLSKLQADYPELTIGHCFPTPQNFQRKTVGGIEYFPLIVAQNKFIPWVNRITGRISQTGLLDEIQKVVEDFCPDVIHIFGTEKSFGLLKLKKNIPIVIQIQGLLRWIFPVYSGTISLRELIIAAGIGNYIKGGYFSDYTNMKKSVKREQGILTSAKYVIGTTQFDEEYLKELNPVAHFFKLNLILRDEFYHTSYKHPESFNIVTTSNEYPYKGFDVIIKTVELLVSKGFNVNWRVIGISETGSFIKIYRKFFPESPAWDHLWFVGTKNAEEIVAELKQNAIYVNPSFIETGPVSLCEAMMVGMPVITSDAGGAKYLVNDGVDGLIFKSGDHTELAGKVIQLFNDRAFANKLGDNARKSALCRHNPVVSIKKYKDIFNKVTEI